MSEHNVKNTSKLSLLALEHHAVLLVGPHEVCLAAVPSEYKEGVDVEFITTDILSIEDARALRDKASGSPIQKDVRRFFISCRQILPPAQNALLKLFEDPPRTARFYLILPHEGILIDTMHSRMMLGFSAPADTVTAGTLTEEFLSASYRERLQTITYLHKKKDSVSMRLLLSEIEKKSMSFSESDKKEVLADLVFASQYRDTAGASPKMLLEHLALSISEPK